jgi:N-ethylmaleimide reductase
MVSDLNSLLFKGDINMLEKLLSTYNLGHTPLKNRVVMAPMTRSRANQGVPTPIMALYYAQRAEAGLIITEGTAPSPNGLGYARIAGCFNPDQVQGWRLVTDQVHKEGAKIFLQMMHTGRASHPANMLPGAKIVAPSAIRLSGTIYTDALQNQPYPVPHALTDSEVTATVQEFVSCAKHAIQAGFDGVEIHAANGYLVEQFLNSAANQRADRWGGSIEGRCRFALEIAGGILKHLPPHQVGIRLSPYGVFNDMGAYPDIDKTYDYLSKQLDKLSVGYIHLVDHHSMGAPQVPDAIKQMIRSNFKGTFILSGGYTPERAEEDLARRRGDLVAFGRPFISNPKLVTHFKNGKKLIEPDFSTFYTPGPKGYTDYT